MAIVETRWHPTFRSLIKKRKSDLLDQLHAVETLADLPRTEVALGDITARELADKILAGMRAYDRKQGAA